MERIKSMFFPGVDTMYTTYEVHIHIPDPERPELQARNCLRMPENARKWVKMGENRTRNDEFIACFGASTP